jgi:hypothetical protein
VVDRAGGEALGCVQHAAALLASLTDGGRVYPGRTDHRGAAIEAYRRAQQMRPFGFLQPEDVVIRPTATVYAELRSAITAELDLSADALDGEQEVRKAEAAERVARLWAELSRSLIEPPMWTVYAIARLGAAADAHARRMRAAADKSVELS